MPDSTTTSSEVLTQLAPTQRILKIIKSQDLPIPQEREKDHLYYVYDKMKLYLYQSMYSDPFSIVEKLPDQSVLVENMLYIVLNGYMYTYSHNSIIELGHIEINEFGDVDPDQLDLLKTVGTVYFMNSEERYIDPQTRTLQLPYQNGTYQLTLNLAKDLIIDRETIISFNEETEQFEVMGAEFQPDKWLKDIYRYRGNWNETIVTEVEEGFNAIKSRVNVADISGNAIQILGQGLYVNANNFAEASRYSDMVYAFANYKNIIDRYVAECMEAIMEVTSTISSETISERIKAILEDYKPTIKDMFDKYADLKQDIYDIDYMIDHDLKAKVTLSKNEIINYVDSKDKAWSYFTEDGDPELFLTPDQMEAQALIIEEYRDVVMTLRTAEPYIPPYVEPEIPEESEPESGEPDPELYDPDENPDYIYGTGEDDDDNLGGIDSTSTYTTVSYPDSMYEEETVPNTHYIINNSGYYEDEQDVSEMIIEEYDKFVIEENKEPEPEPDPDEPGGDDPENPDDPDNPDEPGGDDPDTPGEDEPDTPTDPEGGGEEGGDDESNPEEPEEIPDESGEEDPEGSGSGATEEPEEADDNSEE